MLNLDRSRTADAVSTAQAIAVAMSTGRLPRSWFDAQVRDESEIDDLMFAVNQARREAEERRKRGRQ